jgi:hypothetical protein
MGDLDGPFKLHIPAALPDLVMAGVQVMIPDVALIPLSHNIRKSPDNPHCPRWRPYSCTDAWKRGGCLIRNDECNWLFKRTFGGMI